MISKKIVIVGHFGVGKSSLIKRFVEDVFIDDYKVTIGVHILKKTVRTSDKEINLIIWDTEGAESVEELLPAYLLGTHGFIFVCDVTRPKTFENLQEQLELLSTFNKLAPILTVGNKSDLLPKGTIHEAKEAMPFLDVLTSAKDGKNVQRLFEKMAKLIIS
ncbi:MAG: GTP-binding protein [Nonlabens sp.]|nr:GTP-binding protein [Nonlabens sp.]